MKQYIAALDQGTTSTRCIIFDRKAACRWASAQREYTQLYPQPGWVEHDPMEIYSSQYGGADGSAGADGHNAGGDCGDRHHQPAGNYHHVG